MLGIPRNISKKQFAKDLYSEISEDNVFNGAAALAFYFFLAIFPALIFVLSLLPYLPIEHLNEAVMDFIRQALPGSAATALEGAVGEVTNAKHGGLLSVGGILTLWAASSGLYAVMQQLNITYDVSETRPFWKSRGEALLLTIGFSILTLLAFALIVFGGRIQDWVQGHFSLGDAVIIAFAAFRWVVILFLLMTGFALTYYFGPDVEQKFKFITPGAVMGVVIMVIASIGFRVYVDHFGNYAATYGSLGAVIALMFWLYIVGAVILVGSEINALVEHDSVEGKNKGEHKIPKNSRGLKERRWKNQHGLPQGPRNEPLPPRVPTDAWPVVAAPRFKGSEVLLAAAALLFYGVSRRKSV